MIFNMDSKDLGVRVKEEEIMWLLGSQSRGELTCSTVFWTVQIKLLDSFDGDHYRKAVNFKLTWEVIRNPTCNIHHITSVDKSENLTHRWGCNPWPHGFRIRRYSTPATRWTFFSYLSICLLFFIQGREGCSSCTESDRQCKDVKRQEWMCPSVKLDFSCVFIISL